MSKPRPKVKCPSCGNVSRPVSGFCNRCLEPLPLGGAPRAVPLALAGLLALLAIGLVGGQNLLVGPAQQRAAASAAASGSPAVAPTVLAATSTPVATLTAPSASPTQAATPTTAPTATAASAVAGSSSSPAASSARAPSASPLTAAAVDVNAMPNTATAGERLLPRERLLGPSTRSAGRR